MQIPRRRVYLKREVIQVMTLHLPVVVEQDEDGVFIVSAPTFRGCRSYGRTVEEAMKNIAEAAELCLKDEPLEPNERFVGVRDLQVEIPA